MNEAETRADHIDPALKAAGWGVVDGSQIRREYPITLGRLEGQGRRGKALTADYVLIYRTHKLAVIEAKAWDEPLTLGVAQAKDYAGKLAVRFTYAATGKASTESTWRRARRANSRATRRQMSFGTSHLLIRTRGATVSRPCLSKIGVDISRAATTRTSRSSGCWRPSRKTDAHSAHPRHRHG